MARDKLSIEPFRASHLTEIMVGGYMTQLGKMYEQCPSVTLREVATEEIMCCIGVFMPWPGSGEAWMHMGPHWTRHLIEIYLKAKMMIETPWDGLRLHRLTSYVEGDSDPKQNFLRRLGFSWEHTMEGYGPGGSPVHIYSRTRGT